MHRPQCHWARSNAWFSWCPTNNTERNKVLPHGDTGGPKLSHIIKKVFSPAGSSISKCALSCFLPYWSSHVKELHAEVLGVGTVPVFFHKLDNSELEFCRIRNYCNSSQGTSKNMTDGWRNLKFRNHTSICCCVDAKNEGNSWRDGPSHVFYAENSVCCVVSVHSHGGGVEEMKANARAVLMTHQQVWVFGYSILGP